MLKRSVSYAGPIVLVLLSAACANQRLAPVVVGTQSGGPTISSIAGSSYGTAPYNISTSPAADAPYTPPASIPAPTYNSDGTGTYTPFYVSVNISTAIHTVVRGDTVYNISKCYNITQDNLRTWNNPADNTISIGQTLRVEPEGYVASAASANRPPMPITTTTAPIPSTPVNAPTVSTSNSRNVSGITWQRPTAGSVIASFGGSDKGVGIAGTQGQPVAAAADDKVAYAGSGLCGHGNLVIIQHSPSFLSTYDHNQHLLANENQTVKRGQTIAHMGSTDASRTQLHFEIRQNGKPVNPANHVAF